MEYEVYVQSQCQMFYKIHEPMSVGPNVCSSFLSQCLSPFDIHT